MKIIFKKFGLLFLLIFVVTIGIALAITTYLFDKNINQPLIVAEPVLITIAKGTRIKQLSHKLMQKGLLKNSFWLKNYVRLFPRFAKLKVGTYQIKKGFTVKQLLLLLISGKEYQFTITFIEGTTFKQWLNLLHHQKHLQHNLLNKSTSEIAHLLAIKQVNPEGLFFPDTYAYTANTDELTLLQRAHNKMMKELAYIWQHRATNLPYTTSYQALILASIIEKETAQREEQPLIAAVFINRLRKNMRLQTDPTVIYGLGKRFHGDLKRFHLEEKTPYNTYKIKGLPPTPIAMPSLSSLNASVTPAKSNYLYFVSKGNGYHVFSSTLKEHNEAVVRYQLKITSPSEHK